MPPTDASLSLGSFINELALAWQKLAIYSAGHPQREQAIGRAHALLVRLTAPRGSLAIGVTRDALLGLDEKLTAVGATRIAAALYLREVGVLRVLDGVEPVELEHLLRLLPRGHLSAAGRRLDDELAAAGVTHILVETVDFSGVIATDSLEAAPAATREHSLWDDIVRRMLADSRLQGLRGAGGISFQSSDYGSLDDVMRVVNSLLASHGAAPQSGATPAVAGGLDDLRTALSGIVGGSVSEQLLAAQSPEARRSTVRHVAELLRALPAGMREGVLDAAVREIVTGDDTALALEQLGSGVSAAQLVGSLRRLRADKVAFSPRVVSVVESLVTTAVSGRADDSGRPAAPQPARELLDQELRRVFADEDVDRAPSTLPGLDERSLISLAKLQQPVPFRTRSQDLEPYLESLTDQRLTALLSHTLIDLLTRPLFDSESIGWIIGREQEMFRGLLAGGRFAAAARVVETLREIAFAPERTTPVRLAAERCLETLRQSDTLTALVDSLAEARPSEVPVQRLLEVLGPDAVRQLLLILGEETDLSRRRRLFDLLAGLGPTVVPPALELLGDPRWYMTRNVLSLLRRVGEGIGPEVLQQGLTHADSRVRLEAIKCLPDYRGKLPAAIVEGLINDPDARTAEAAVAALGSARVGAAVEPLVALLERRDPMGRQRALRLKALHALGEIGDPAVLPRLKQFFRTWFALVSPEERRAAYASLQSYPPAARAPWVRQGLRATDTVVRDTCRRLEAGGAAGAGGTSRPGKGS